MACSICLSVLPVGGSTVESNSGPNQHVRIDLICCASFDTDWVIESSYSVFTVIGGKL